MYGFRRLTSSVSCIRCYARARIVSNGEKKHTSLFQFGNFSKLMVPTKKQLDMTGTLIDDFESLRIFPSVRVAMINEIKDLYNLKSTYIQSKDDLVISPSPVQVEAIRKINKERKPRRKSTDKPVEENDIYKLLINNNQENQLKVFTVAAETGSGKTWSYLACIMSKLKEDDMKRFNINRKTYEESRAIPMIRAIILLPTNDLVNQVYKTLKLSNTLSLDLDKNMKAKYFNVEMYSKFLAMESETNTLNFNILKWGAGEPASKFFNAIKESTVDILVTTPTKLQSLGKQHSQDANPYRYLYNTQYCVVDEADTLFDPSWFPDTTAILNKLSKCKDIILCSATMPKNFSHKITNYFTGQIINVITPSLHKIPKQIDIKVIDSEEKPYQGIKARALAQALYAIHKDATEPGYTKRVIVFVNHKKDVSPLRSLLATKYHQDLDDLVALSGDDSPLERSEKIKPFLELPQPIQPGQSALKVLITTDLYARGVNFQNVKNVILMDFPNNSVDLLHRIGRTGRMKQSGRVFIITDKKSRKSWIKALPNASKRGVRIA